MNKETINRYNLHSVAKLARFIEVFQISFLISHEVARKSQYFTATYYVYQKSEVIKNGDWHFSGWWLSKILFLGGEYP